MYNFLVDSHCHLNYTEFVNGIEEVINEAKTNNVKILQTISTKIADFAHVTNIASTHENIFASIGIHPHETDATLENSSIEKLEDKISHYLKDPKVTALGETGLDYHYYKSIKKNQVDSFLLHIELARKNNLPLVIHTRKADDDTAKILETEMKKGSFTGVLHCFTSSMQLAQKALEMGFYISISGIVTFSNSLELQKIVKTIPLNKLLVETDSPYLAPVPYRGKSNKPAYLKKTAEFIADLKQIPFQKLQHITTENYLSLFNRAKV